jgi:hypothetical protein
MPARDPHSPVERILTHDGGESGAGRPLSRRALQAQRSLEDYLKAGNRPRWMERLVDIEAGMATHRRRLQRAYRALQRECGPDAELFASRWREVARSWSFEELNELIHQHNEYFPIERQLPVDIRTRDYVLINGRPYRRPILGPGWVLEQFPASGQTETRPR